MKKFAIDLIESGDIYDIQKLNSFLHSADKKTIRELNSEFRDKWIEHGTLTYYAEDFPKYQKSKRLEEGLEVFVLFLLYNALQ